MPVSRYRNAFAAIVASAMLPTVGRAQTITFEDLAPVRSEFVSLGITTTYHGFHWGSTLYGTGNPSGTGWAVASVANPAVAPAPTPVSGTAYGWNFNGPQSLFIDFLAPTYVQGASFAWLGTGFPGNSSSMQLFGYDGLGNQLFSSSVLTLSGSFQYLAADFAGVQALEMRGDNNPSWFSVDDIILGVPAAVVPEPASLALLATGLLGTGLVARRRRTA